MSGLAQEAETMELPGSTYLYTLATLAMTFAGFCAIVIVLRQTTGNYVSGFHLVLTRLYLEAGLFSDNRYSRNPSTR
jgi:hypothetical protein